MSAATEQDLPEIFYGGCGTEGCQHCAPLFDADNNVIPGTENWEPKSDVLDSCG